MRGCARNGISMLAVMSESRAQATQRAGRAGRDGPGVCFRLFTETAFAALADVAQPELQRIDLAAVVLQVERRS